MAKPLIAHIRKSDQTKQYLSDHLKETANLSGMFAKKIGLQEHGELVGLLHDIGKASIEFQNYIASAEGLINPDEDEYVDANNKKGKVDHSSAGAQVIHKYLFNKNLENRLVAQILSLCVASHHSGMIDCLSPSGKDNFTRRMNKPEDKTHLKEVLNNIDEDIRRKIEEYVDNESIVKRLVEILKSLKEEKDNADTMNFKIGLLVRFLFSCLLDADRINTADFELPENKFISNEDKYPDWDKLIERFNQKKFHNKNKIDNIRSKISQECYEFSKKSKGLYQLTVPTGGGKTFASLRFALNHAKNHFMDRIIYVIPYTSIIDQNAQEVRKVLDDKDVDGYNLGNVVLEHHSNITPEEESKRQNLLSENWDAPIVFTTQVQFLETLFSSGTRSARRMHRLANAIIIFDEVQTIPVRSVHLFNLAIRFLVNNCGTTAILCTATQPLLNEVEPVERALSIKPEQRMVSDVKKVFNELKRVEVKDKRKVDGWSELDIITFIHKELKKSNSVLMIVNTKAAARNIYAHLRMGNGAEIYHLSTNMCPAHRLNALQAVKYRLNNDQPTVCVSTQLIEAGIDIDFKSVIRYLAGLDSIAQAAGRCNRHGIRKQGNVYIINPDNEELGKLEGIKQGKECAERVLNEYKDNPLQFDEDILSPSLMDRYYLYYFHAKKYKMNYPVTERSIIGRNDNLFSLLSSNTLSINEYQRINGTQPNIPLKHSFQSASLAFRAIDSPTRGVIVPYGEAGKQIINELCAAFDFGEQYKLLKKAQRYTVNLFPETFENLIKQNAIFEVQQGTDIYYLDNQYYSDEIGLSKEIVNEMETYTF